MIEDEHIKRLRQLENLADWMDSRFEIPGTGFRFGLDGLLGLIPGVGDTITLVISSWIVGAADRMGAPGSMKLKMAWNIMLDWLVGLIPLVGDLFDFGWKANRRNIELLRRHVAEQGGIIEGQARPVQNGHTKNSV